jgi:hypothetical protein
MSQHPYSSFWGPDDRAEALILGCARLASLAVAASLGWAAWTLMLA